MAIERRIDTATWDDPWFSDLPPDGKLLFFYMLTNRRTTSCGAFEITLRAMSFETGIGTERIRELLAMFGERVQWFPDEQIIFVRNFYRHQKPNASFTVNAQRAAAALPPVVRDTVYAVYPTLRTGCDSGEDTVSAGWGQGGDTPSLEVEVEVEPEVEPERAPEGDAALARDGSSSEVDPSECERRIAGLVQQVRGMAGVPQPEIVLHLREIISTRETPVSEQALLADALRFRDHWNTKRSNQPAERWRGWRTAMTNWFTRTNEQPRAAPASRAGQLSTVERSLANIRRVDSILERQEAG